MKQPLLCMFLGYPGSGKSFFARQLADKIQAVRINGDSMRIALYGSVEGIEKASGDKLQANKQVFGALDYVAEQVLIAGHSVVYDAHHNKRSIRADLEQLASKHHALPIVIWVKTDYDLAFKRGQEREASADQRQFSEAKMKEVMARHSANFNEPISTEHIITIDGVMAFDQQYAAFQQQITNILS